MTVTVDVVFLILAIVCFVLAAFAIPGPKGGWTPVGLIFVSLFLWP